MEDHDIHIASRPEGQPHQVSGAAQSLRRDGGATPDSQTQASPLSQPLTDVKPLTERPSIEQASCD